MLLVGVLSVLRFAAGSGAGLRAVFQPLILWPLAPYVPAFLACAFVQGTKAAVACLLGCALLSGYGVYAYERTLAHPDPQGGLVMLFVPGPQLVFSLVLCFVLWAASVWHVAAHRPDPS